jgi:hypothetical protein
MKGYSLFLANFPDQRKHQRELNDELKFYAQNREQTKKNRNDTICHHIVIHEMGPL